MIVVKHVDSIFGSLLPIRLSTFRLVTQVSGRSGNTLNRCKRLLEVLSKIQYVQLVKRIEQTVLKTQWIYWQAGVSIHAIVNQYAQSLKGSTEKVKCYPDGLKIMGRVLQYMYLCFHTNRISLLQTIIKKMY